jgi:hypothetical protein
MKIRSDFTPINVSAQAAPIMSRRMQVAKQRATPVAAPTMPKAPKIRAPKIKY